MKTYEYFQVTEVYNKKVLKVTFNRPPVNALVKEVYDEISSIIEYIKNNNHIRVAILHSEGKHFSAGADVKQLKKDSEPEASVRRAALRQAIEDLYNCPVPLLTAVHGAAVGAGAIFAACGDIILASEDAHFSLPEINVGIIGGAKGLTRFAPPQKIRYMALTGEKLSAKEAHQFGGVEKLVKDTELLPQAIQLAESIADKGEETVRKWKEALLATEGMDVVTGFMVEQNLSMELAQLNKE